MGVSSNGDFEMLLRRLLEGKFHSAYIVGEDPVSQLPEGDKVKSALEKLSFLVVQDIHLSATAKLAHVVLPAAHFGEKEGTYTNRKGRVQRVRAAVVPPAGALQDWEIFARLLMQGGEKISYSTPSEVFQAIAREVSRYRGLSYAKIGDQGLQLSDEKQQP
jgi:predicted molibdopterin-dependent oxidoreductase YjgC